MHPYELKIMEFMQKVATGSVAISDELLKPAIKDIEFYMRRMYEDDPKRPYTLRLSAVGRPLCQQQLEKAKAPALDDEWNNPLRMFFGGVLEATSVCLLKAAGINVEEEQTKVKLLVAVTAPIRVHGLNEPIPLNYAEGRFIEVNGTLDLVIDGKVWDIKSASQFMYKEKFESYETLKADDTFGYLAQLFGYAKARGIPPGGWIVIDKSSGHMKVITVPDNYAAEMEEQLAKITTNVKAIVYNEKFKRQYSDVDETYKKKFTGNKVLEPPCIFCKFRYSCWPGLQFLPSTSSTAFDKPHKFYTRILNENLQLQSKGAQVTAESS